MGWIILIVLVVGGVLVWRNRDAVMARVLGQDESRVRRQITRKDR
jgi:hypothetical protein